MNKDSFLRTYDTGIPSSGGMLHDNNNNGRSSSSSSDNDESEVLLLYASKSALPTTTNDSSQGTLLMNSASSAAVNGDEERRIIIQPFDTSVEDATQNCDALHIVTVQKSVNRQCFALVGNSNSVLNMHVQRWVRMLPKKNQQRDQQLEKGSNSNSNSNNPLVLVGRGQDGSRDEFRPPLWSQTRQHWQILSKYLTASETILKSLKVTLEKINRDNTVIVMTTNAGHASMLKNFVCSSKARGFDLSNVLVVATDRKAELMAKDAGLATFYHDEVRANEFPQLCSIIFLCPPTHYYNKP